MQKRTDGRTEGGLSQSSLLQCAAAGAAAAPRWAVGRLLGLVDSAAAAAAAVGGHYGAVTAAMDKGNGRGPLCLIANKGGSGIELAASYVDSRTIHIQGRHKALGRAFDN